MAFYTLLYEKKWTNPTSWHRQTHLARKVLNNAKVLLAVFMTSQSDPNLYTRSMESMQSAERDGSQEGCKQTASHLGESKVSAVHWLCFWICTKKKHLRSVESDITSDTEGGSFSLAMAFFCFSHTEIVGLIL